MSCSRNATSVSMEDTRILHSGGVCSHDLCLLVWIVLVRVCWSVACAAKLYVCLSPVVSDEDL